MRTVFTAIVALIAILVPLALADGDGTAAEESAPVATIAKRVEAVRGQQFKQLPDPVRVTAAEARKEGLADFDRAYPPEERDADERFYEMLGLFPKDTDLRSVNENIFGSQVAGYYDPRTKRMRIVESASTANRVTDEMTIAHELDHALEDQAIGFDMDRAEGTGDPALAYTALIEGAATKVMYDYVDRYFDSDTALGSLLGSSFASPSTEGIPPFIVEQLTWPYVGGEAFVRELYSKGGNTWTLIDLAERDRPPSSTEQVLHPAKYLAAEEPDEVALPEPGGAWKELTGGVFGEWQTARLLATAGPQQPRAAAGWGGDRYALYGRGSARAAVLRWAWDTPKDAAEFLVALRRVPVDGLGANATGDQTWRTEDGRDIAIAFAGGEVTLAIAEDPATASRLASDRSG